MRPGRWAPGGAGEAPRLVLGIRRPPVVSKHLENDRRWKDCIILASRFWDEDLKLLYVANKSHLSLCIKKKPLSAKDCVTCSTESS